MSLIDHVKTEDELLELKVQVLAMHLLTCIEEHASAPIKRQGLAARFLRDYPRNKTPDSLYAIEEALMYLEREMLIGADPTAPELIFVTRSGKKAVKEANGSLSLAGR